MICQKVNIIAFYGNISLFWGDILKKTEIYHENREIKCKIVEIT